MRSILVATILLTLSIPAQAAVRWEVLQSDARELRLRVVSEGARLERTELDGVERVAVVLPGAPSVGETGWPMLPRAARWIALPAEGDATVEIRVVSVEELGRGRVLPVPRPDVVQNVESAWVGIEVQEDAEGFDGFVLGAVQAVDLGEPVFHRRQRIAPLRIQPVLYSASDGRLQLAREIEVTVRFPAQRTQLTLMPEPGSVDASLQGALLNPRQAELWRCLSPEQKSRRDRWNSAGFTSRERAPMAGVGILDPAQVVAPEIRVRVGRTGLVRLRVKDLVDDHGFSPTVPRRFLRLVRKRVTDPGDALYPAVRVADVPLAFVDDLDENTTVTDRDEFFFYARSAQDDWSEQTIDGDAFPRAMSIRPDSFNSDNVYFLLVMDPGAGSWGRMQHVALSPSTGANVQASYRRWEMFTGDQGYRDDPSSPWIERYYWNDRLDKDVQRSLRLVHPAANSVFDVRWKAGGHGSATFTTNRFSLVQGNQETLLNELNLTGSGSLSDWSRQLSTNDFAHGSLTFKVQRFAGQLSVGLNAFFSDVELEYDALYAADNDQLRFHAGSTGENVDLEVAGFTRTDLYAFDITDPLAPKVVDLAAANLVPVGTGVDTRYTVSWNVPQAVAERREFLVGSRASFPRVFTESLEADPVVDLLDAVDGLQIVAVGPESFRAPMQPWLDWRNASYADEGWTAGYVDVQQIYDQFSGGLVSPEAIRDFAEYAYLRWQAVALVLVGDANEDVRGIGADAGPNHVPPSLHLQSFSTVRELLASDKWFGTFSYAGPRYPVGLQAPSDLLVGRLAAGNEAELTAIVQKIIAYEQPSIDDAWRSRTLWAADDAYSTSLLGSTGTNCYQYYSIEDEFERSQGIGASFARGALDSILVGATWDVDRYTRDYRLDVACENLTAVRSGYSASHASAFPDTLSEGWLMVSYQGHANYNVLGHESFFLSSQVGQLSNTGRPFLFFGMGCHVSDFLRPTEGRQSPSLGEWMVTLPERGAIATYGSSGFEFLTPNARFMETIAETFFAAARTSSSILGAAPPSQWILGDVMAQAELVGLGLAVSRGDEMVAQYNILGDPLLRMDAAAPRLHARGVDGPLVGGQQIVADAGMNTASLEFDLVDETGIERLTIRDSEGRDYASSIPALEGDDPRRVAVTVAVPIVPQAYDLNVELFDSAYPGIRPRVLTLTVPLQWTLSVDGEVFPDPDALELDDIAPKQLSLEIVSPVELAAEEIAVSFDGAILGPLRKSGSGRNWTLDFTARSEAGAALGEFALELRGYRTLLSTPDGGGGGGEPLAIRRHVPFPNPVPRAGTRILVDVEGAVEALRLTVYDLAGRAVFSHRTDQLGGREGSIFVEYDARDRYGDELANGTYFYRVEVFGPAGSVRGDMGRLVIMR